MAALSDRGTSGVLRRGVLGLAAVTVVATGVELAVERHWTQPSQLIAWAALGVGAVAFALVAWRASAGRLRLARLLALAVVLSAAIGVWQHVVSNHDAGPLDAEYTDTWDSLSEPARWWLSITKTVGPSPLLAPGALAQAGLLVLLATVRHPA